MNLKRMGYTQFLLVVENFDLHAITIANLIDVINSNKVPQEVSYFAD
jgi:hypothetical protein